MFAIPPASEISRNNVSRLGELESYIATIIFKLFSKS